MLTSVPFPSGSDAVARNKILVPATKEEVLVGRNQLTTGLAARALLKSCVSRMKPGNRSLWIRIQVFIWLLGWKFRWVQIHSRRTVRRGSAAGRSLNHFFASSGWD